MRLGRNYFVFAASVIGLAGCGGGQPPATQSTPPAAEPPATADSAVPAETAAPAAAGDLAAMIAAADVAKGKTLFLQCRACHSLAPESEPGKIGPTLYGVIGRPAGSVAGFAYSDAVAQSGKTWTVDQIDHWLEKPSEFLPGNKMVFIGLKNPQDRANVLAYIQQESAKPAGQ